MVRHEAAEAAGAIGCPGAWELVEEHLKDGTREVAETCQLAVQRMAWYEQKEKKKEEKEKKRIKEKQSGGVGEEEEGKEEKEGKEAAAAAVVIKRYLSVDPAPPAAPGTPTQELVATLLDDSPATPIFDRYRALFSLRDSGGEQAVSALCRALRSSSSALLKHEVAYVLGQMQEPSSLNALKECLADVAEHGMVRHEAAEALGALGAEAAVPALKAGCSDRDPVVSQSCVVALDVLAHERSGAFEYAAGA
jgi:deoxyhypusine monooxygenase